MNIFDIRSNKSKNKNASKGLEFDYSDPNIAYLGGGGGSTTTGGGTVVQSTDPVAAELAGTMQANAANTAAQDYNASIQEAITLLAGYLQQNSLWPEEHLRGTRIPWTNPTAPTALARLALPGWATK